MSLGGTSYLSYRSRCHGQTTAVGRPQAERGRSLSARGEYNPEPPTCSGTLTAVAPLRWPPNNTAAVHVRTGVSGVRVRQGPRDAAKGVHEAGTNTQPRNRSSASSPSSSSTLGRSSHQIGGRGHSASGTGSPLEIL